MTNRDVRKKRLTVGWLLLFTAIIAQLPWVACSLSGTGSVSSFLKGTFREDINKSAENWAAYNGKKSFLCNYDDREDGLYDRYVPCEFRDSRGGSVIMSCASTGCKNTEKKKSRWPR